MHVIVIGDRADPSFPGLGQLVPDVYLRPHIKLSVHTLGLTVDLVVGTIVQDVYHPKPRTRQPTLTYLLPYCQGNVQFFQCNKHPSIAHTATLPETRGRLLQ